MDWQKVSNSLPSALLPLCVCGFRSCQTPDDQICRAIVSYINDLAELLHNHFYLMPCFSTAGLSLVVFTGYTHTHKLTRVAEWLRG